MPPPRRPRGVVLVEDLPPLSVDAVHFVPVPERMSPIQQADQGRLAVEPLERLGEVLGQAVCHIDAEPVDPAVGPEPEGLEEVVADLTVVPVQVRLLGGEQVQVPLSVGNAGPGWPAEHGDPVRGRLRPVRAKSIAEDVPVPGRGSHRGGQRLAKPGVAAGGVVGDDIDDDLDPPRVQQGGQLIEVSECAQLRVDVAVVVHVVPAVREGRGVERAEPNRVDAQRGQVGDPGNDPPEVAEAVPAGVGEAARVDLVHHRLPPPVGAGGGRAR